MRLSVVTYNIKFSSLIFEHEIPRLVEELDAAVICLQEFPLLKFEAWRQVMALLGYHFHLKEKTCETLLGIHQANVIFSRFPLEEICKIDLTYKDHEARICQFCLIKAEEGNITLLHTHLGLRRQERLFQMRKIRKITESRPVGEKLILLGDLNDWNNAGERELGSLFQEAHHYLHGQSAKTFPARLPLFRLDRIYFRNASLDSCHALGSSFIRKKSDHLPLRAIFDVR